MIQEMLKAKKLPRLKSREEMLDILLREEYGYLPPKPDSISYRVEENAQENYCAGKASLDRVYIRVELGGRFFEIPFYAAIPKNKENIPFFVCINFYEDACNRYFPAEEIIDRGYAVLHLCYTDVTADNDDFTDGLASIVFDEGIRNPASCGKIALWAWSAQRVLDWAYTKPCLKHDTPMVCGHSRLGKTALLAAATDKRFAFAFSNDSGCSGAALSRGKNGETIADITGKFPYWFCPNYLNYADKEYEMPFDQHYLLASIAPRYAYVSSAREDEWADPKAEYLNCFAASEAYEYLKKTGFVADNSFPKEATCFHGGNIGYHYREGTHYFSRTDWNNFMDFYEKKEEIK